MDYVKQKPKVLILVEAGPLLEDLLAGLPRNFATRVCLPKRPGQVALVLVEQHPEMALSK